MATKEKQGKKEAPLNRYEVLEGFHVEQRFGDNDEITHVTHTKGKIVKSRKPLDKIFVNKFRNLDKPTAALKEGHTGPDMMDRNDVLDGTNPELVKRIRQEEYAKAEEEIRKRTDEAAEAARKRAEEEQEEVEEDDDEAEEDEDEDLGEEVTEDFEGAEEKKLTVHKKDRKFVVRDDDGEQLHEEPMTKKQAKSFIEKHGETEE